MPMWRRLRLGSWTPTSCGAIGSLGLRDSFPRVLFAGWRALPVPPDLPAAVALSLNVLRELRGGAHLSAVHAAGIGPVGAIVAAPDPVRGGPPGAERFGWREPYPAPDPDGRILAEQLTSTICVPAFAHLSSGELDRFVALVIEARSFLDD